MLRDLSIPEYLDWGYQKLRDPLYRNAAHLILNAVLGGALGFLFWLVVARYFPSADVGIAASIIAAASLLGYLSSLGLGTGLIMYLPSSKESPARLILPAITITTAVALAAGTIFLISIGSWTQVIRLDVGGVLLPHFVMIFTVVYALNPLVDSCFLAARRAVFVLHRTLVFNGLRLPLLVILAAALGAGSILASMGAALVGALLVGIFVFLPHLHRGLRRIRHAVQLRTLREIIPYSLGNHVADGLVALPAGILPLILLAEHSPSASAHFYVAWLVASFTFVVPISAARSLFVEGAQPGASLGGHTIRAVRFGLLLLVPAVAVLLLTAPWILGFFGGGYAAEATTLLRVLVVSSFSVTINTAYTTYLRVRERIPELLGISAVLGIGVVSVSYLLLPPLGLLATGIAFAAIQVLVTSYAVLGHLGAIRAALSRSKSWLRGASDRKA